MPVVKIGDQILDAPEGCHVIRLNLVADKEQRRTLSHLFHDYDDFKVGLARKLAKALHLLQHKRDYVRLIRQRAATRQSNEKKIGEINTQLRDLIKEHNLDKAGVYKAARELRNGSYKDRCLNSLIVQSIADNLLAGLTKVFFGEGGDLRVSRYGEMDVIASKQDRSALIFDPRSMTLFFQARSRKAGGKPSEWISVQARVPRTSDARDELERLERKHTAFLSAKGSVPNGYNPIRYCAMRRRYCMDHGLVKTVFELLVVVAGPAPDRKKIKTIGKGRVGLDASTFTHAVVAEDHVELLTPSPSMLELMDKVAEVQRQMDDEFRKHNEKWFDKDGQFRRPDDLAVASRGPVKTERYQRLRFRVKWMLQRFRDWRKSEFNRHGNRLVSMGNEFYVEKMNYKALQKRGAQEVTVTTTDEAGNVETHVETWLKGRFGASILKAAPGLFFDILERKVVAAGGKFIRVWPGDIKASQYNPLTGECVTHGLDERCIQVDGGRRVQRDLLAANTLRYCVRSEDGDGGKPKAKTEDKICSAGNRVRPKCKKKTKERVKYEIDKEACREGFERFRKAQDAYMEALVELGAKMHASVGLDDFI